MRNAQHESTSAVDTYTCTGHCRPSALSSSYAKPAERGKRWGEGFDVSDGGGRQHAAWHAPTLAATRGRVGKMTNVFLNREASASAHGCARERARESAAGTHETYHARQASCRAFTAADSRSPQERVPPLGLCTAPLQLRFEIVLPNLGFFEKQMHIIIRSWIDVSCQPQKRHSRKNKL